MLAVISWWVLHGYCHFLLFPDALWIVAVISWPFVVGPPTFLSAILHKCRHFIAYILGHSVPKPLRNTFCGWPTHFSLSHSTQMSSLHSIHLGSFCP